MNEKKVDLNEVVATKVNEAGVLAVTKGAVIGAHLRVGLRSLLRDAAPEKHAEYKAIKYPGGKGTDTTETRLAAVRFLFDAARDLLVAHYVPTNTLAPKAPEKGEEWKGEGDETGEES